MSNTIEIRESVLRFAELMELTLRLNDYKGGWENEPPRALLKRLKDEVTELEIALDFAEYDVEKEAECVDVANFAMMIADVLWRNRQQINSGAV
jgi:hypothetical protein